MMWGRGSDAYENDADLSRVVVIGTSSSGKTTFAERLATILRAPCVELDALFWGPGWTPRADFDRDVVVAVETPRWVIDGNYARVRDLVWRRCTAIVWLDYSFARVFGQALRRTLRRLARREPLYGGNRETIAGTLFDLEAPVWLVVRTHGTRRRQFPQFLARPEYRHAAVIRLRTPAAAAAFLAATGARQR